jgi:four helix bundle protein
MGESFKDLVVWRAVDLCLATYRFTASFPSDERFGLTNQLRRASISIASNIAEGYGKASRGDYLQFLGHARGSTLEAQTQLIIAEKLGFGDPSAHAVITDLADQVSKMLVAMMNRLGKK